MPTTYNTGQGIAKGISDLRRKELIRFGVDYFDGKIAEYQKEAQEIKERMYSEYGKEKTDEAIARMNRMVKK